MKSIAELRQQIEKEIAAISYPTSLMIYTALSVIFWP